MVKPLIAIAGVLGFVVSYLWVLLCVYVSTYRYKYIQTLTTVCSLKTLKGDMFAEQHVYGLFRKSITVCRRAYQARY